LALQVGARTADRNIERASGAHHTHGAGDHRRITALNFLLNDTSAIAVVSLLTEQEGISRHQAHRYVSAGYAQIRADIENCGVDCVAQVSKLVHVLETICELAPVAKQFNAVVAASRELRELLGLAADRRGTRSLKPGKLLRSGTKRLFEPVLHLVC
jgi:hypothetical protein